MNEEVLKKLKRYTPYLGILLVGIVLGSLSFHNEKISTTPAEVAPSISAYTCSMHPNINSEEPGSCPLCGMDLVAEAGGHHLGPNQFTMTESAMALANIRTTTLTLKHNTERTVTLSGTITPNEKTNTVQTTLFDGRIDRLDINFVGEYVRKGQEIGLIYSPELYLAQDKLLTAASYKDTHKKLYDASRYSLGLWKLTDEQIDRVLRTGKPLMNFPLIADVSGTVTEIIADEGNYYKQGDPLFKLSKLGTVWAVFDAYESQLGALKVGQKINITTNALPGRDWTGHIDFIEPVLNKEKRTVVVRADLSNAKGLLKPGMFIEGKVSGALSTGVLTVPKSSVLWTGKRSLVYRRPHANKEIFEMVEVSLGHSLGEDYVLLDGLSHGDEIVVNGTFTVDAAAQLSRKNSMMSLKSRPSDVTANPTDARPSFDGKVRNHLIAIVTTYLKLKDALVAGELKKAKNSANEMHELVATVPTNLQSTEHKSLIKKVSKLSFEIAEETDVEKQRRSFKPLSESIIQLAALVHIPNQSLYVQHCPMADENRGARWLSFESTIRNPYFGDKMLFCGTVTDQLQ